ncbi:MAG: sigma-54-dependent Fis family transcriptional regulator [Deltaproteobacteria bacterium]|nr:MAG: sigma-54-dependent Fis family transcriptional regulator [Deltaproteobacteria bacterium]
MTRLFLCDDEEDILIYLKKLLQRRGYQVETFLRGADLLARLEGSGGEKVGLILQDVRMPDLDGLQVLRRARKLAPEVPVVVMSAFGAIDDAVQAVKLGAYDYLTKPFPKEKVLGVVENALEHRRLAVENRELRDRLNRRDTSGEIVFRSLRFREVYDLALQVAGSDANVLVLGESGTGKELIARLLHRHSPRRERTFVSLNCATLADNLLESQLFGHVRGAFTGAISNQRGLIEEAEGGTLLLDEVGDMSPAVQAKLLRVIQERDYTPLGTTRPRSADVRLVAATNKDLAREVAEGRFREDLYYRLNVITLALPPLRERPEDIEPLALFFLRRFAARLRKEIHGFDAAAIRRLAEYPWPGNIRELENVIERAAILTRTALVGGDDLPELRRPGGTPAPAPAGALLALEVVERNHIADVLHQTGFHKSRAAEILGISRKTLDRKIAEFGLAGQGG